MRLHSGVNTKTKTHISYTTSDSIQIYSELESSKMNGHAENRAIGKWLAEKDSGNESEPELTSWDFSKLNISPKPLHNRPLRSQTKAGANDTLKSSVTALQTAEMHHSKISTTQSGPSATMETGKDGAGFRRCLRSRVKHTSNKVGTIGDPTSTESNNNIAQYPSPRKSVPHYTHCDNIIKTTDTILAMALTQVVQKPARSRPFDAASLYSVTSDDFNESDDELISINGDSNSDYTNAAKSPRLSSKRKRTTTLSADLEVENLLSPSVDDSVSSGDNFSVSDFSETEEIMSCEIPRKRLCSVAPADNRPYLDLEKMQHKVEKSASLTNKRRPRAIRIMCFSPIKNISGLNRPATRSLTNRELVMTTRFCPLTPVESFPTDFIS